MASASIPSANKPANDLILDHTVQLKQKKHKYLEEWYLNDISDVAVTSVHSEKTRLKKLIMIIIIMKKTQETTVFNGHQKLTSIMKFKLEK